MQVYYYMTSYTEVYEKKEIMKAKLQEMVKRIA